MKHMCYHKPQHHIKYPFNFKHYVYNLSEIALYLDGQQQLALKPIQPDYANGLYIRGYESLFTGTGKQFQHGGLRRVSISVC